MPDEARSADALTTLPVREGYDLWAEVYDSDGNPLIAREERHIGPLIGTVAGLDVADVGCGTGRHALALSKAGARVTALDFSRRMLEIARTKPGDEGRAPLSRLSPSSRPGSARGRCASGPGAPAAGPGA